MPQCLGFQAGELVGSLDLPWYPEAAVAASRPTFGKRRPPGGFSDFRQKFLIHGDGQRRRLSRGRAARGDEAETSPTLIKL